MLELWCQCSKVPKDTTRTQGLCTPKLLQQERWREQRWVCYNMLVEGTPVVLGAFLCLIQKWAFLNVSLKNHPTSCSVSVQTPGQSSHQSQPANGLTNLQIWFSGEGVPLSTNFVETTGHAYPQRKKTHLNLNTHSKTNSKWIMQLNINYNTRKA